MDKTRRVVTLPVKLSEKPSDSDVERAWQVRPSVRSIDGRGRVASAQSWVFGTFATHMPEHEGSYYKNTPEKSLRSLTSRFEVVSKDLRWLQWYLHIDKINQLANQIGDITLINWDSRNYGYINKPLPRAARSGLVRLLP